MMYETVSGTMRPEDKHEIWVAGCPSFLGGADTELLHQIFLWRSAGISVNIVPNDGLKSVPGNMLGMLAELGCPVLSHYNGIFRDKIVVNYCNGPALQRLDVDSLPPYRYRYYMFFNCMTWTFDKEIEHIARGNITHIGMISEYQKKYLMESYGERLPENVKLPGIFMYVPYLEPSLFNPVRKSRDYIGLGRISRDDPAKFSTDCWKIFDDVVVPEKKKVFMLGISRKILDKIGSPPDGLDWMYWTPGSIPIAELFSNIDIMMHKTGGSRESFCRVLLEAVMHDVVPLVERDYAFPEILSRSKYGQELDWLMCLSSAEMSYKASHLAFNPALMDRYRTICKYHILEKYCNRERCLSQWLAIL